jgi:hypothetical protein
MIFFELRYFPSNFFPWAVHTLKNIWQLAVNLGYLPSITVHGNAWSKLLSVIATA